MDTHEPMTLTEIQTKYSDMHTPGEIAIQRVFRGILQRQRTYQLLVQGDIAPFQHLQNTLQSWMRARIRLQNALIDRSDHMRSMLG